MSECLNPRLAYQENEGEKPHFLTTRDYIQASQNNTYLAHKKLLLLPCGKCPNCMSNKSIDWTSRLMKESEEWKYTYFLTLTYDAGHLYYIDSSSRLIKRDVLNKTTHKTLKRDVQLFLKRLREATEITLKYYIVCEAGEITSRTHWHAIFFMNEPFTDLVYYSNNLYTSKTLQKAWSYGLVTLSQDVNERSIKYTIGYTLKKIGEFKLQMMSNGLGLRYLNDKKDDIKFSNGFYLNNGFLVNPPSYFLRKMKESNNPDDVAWVKKYEEGVSCSVEVTKTLDDLFYEMVTQNNPIKGKGVF